jgi:hypothetical protein
MVSWLACSSESGMALVVGAGCSGLMALIFSDRYWRAVGAIVCLLSILGGFGLQDDLEKRHIRLALSQKKACFSFIKEIDDAKVTWAREQNKTYNDLPSVSDLTGPGHSLRELPACPSGGEYVLGKLGEPVACTMHGISK